MRSYLMSKVFEFVCWKPSYTFIFSVFSSKTISYKSGGNCLRNVNWPKFLPSGILRLYKTFRLHTNIHIETGV